MRQARAMCRLHAGAPGRIQETAIRITAHLDGRAMPAHLRAMAQGRLRGVGLALLWPQVP
ncbi:MAG TPA: hypothetical protein DHB48_15125 [Sphingobium sp.]|nr:hypothetical protein [Sphingobium sp.]